MLTFKIDGVDHLYDNTKLMFSEAMEIQKATGVNTKAFDQGLVDGDAMAYGALFWLAQLRTIVAAKGCTLKDAVKELPFADWDINLTEPVQSLRQVEEPDPTEPAPDGSAEATSPDTSEPQPEPTPSPIADAPTSEPSPTSSASAPGSGTS